MTGTADDLWDEESARKWWEMHLPDNCGWSHRTRETKAETHTESACLIPSCRKLIGPKRLVIVDATGMVGG